MWRQRRERGGPDEHPDVQPPQRRHGAPRRRRTQNAVLPDQVAQGREVNLLQDPRGADRAPGDAEELERGRRRVQDGEYRDDVRLVEVSL
jgi:hypothetical protein